MNGSLSSGPPPLPFICPTCGLHMGLYRGEIARGTVPWHFDSRPPRRGRDRGECPQSDKPLPAAVLPPRER